MNFIRKYTPYYRQNLILAVPVIVSQIGQMTVQLVDTFMVGRLSSEGLAAVSFANSIAWPVLMLGMGLAMGITPLVGRAHARGDMSRVVSLLKNSLTLNLMVGVLITLLLLAGSFMLDHMGQSPDIIPIAREYYFYMVASALPVMMYSTARHFLEGIGNTTYTMIITIICNLVNVALNYVLIYGWWLFPEMGAVGAGASTFIARVLMSVLFLLLMLNKAGYRVYIQNFRNVALCRFRIRRLLNIGFPISMQVFIEMAAMSLMAIVVGTFGATVLAGHQIAINIPSLAFMVVLGLQAATTIRVSQDYGLRLYDSMYMSLKASLHLIMAFMILSATIILVFAPQIAAFFSHDQQAIDMATKFLFFGALFQLSDGIQGVMLGGLRGILIVRKPMIYAICVYLFFAIPVGYVCSYVLDFGAFGTWIAFISAVTLLAILYYRLFRKRLVEFMHGSVARVE